MPRRRHRLRGRNHMLTGNAHDREIDCRPPISSTQAYPRTPATGAPSLLTGKAAPWNVKPQDVAKQLAADRAALRRGSEHRHALWCEERLQRCAHRLVVAAVDALEECCRPGDPDPRLRPRPERARASSRTPRRRRRRALSGCRQAPRPQSVRSRARPQAPPGARACGCRRRVPAVRRRRRTRPRPCPGPAAGHRGRSRRYLPVELPEQRTTLDPVRLETRLDEPRTHFR